MKSQFPFVYKLCVPFGSLVFCAALIAAPSTRLQAPTQTAPDNTKMNKDQSSPSADQQKMNSSDRATTQKIRKAIHDDKALSTYAHNIKIITQDGKVTLRGPVGSEEEKSAIEAKAVGIVGQENVTNQIEVMPSK